MKVVIISFCIVGLALRVNGQSLFQVKPADSLSNNLDKFLKIRPDGKNQPFSLKKFDFAEQLTDLNGVNLEKKEKIYRMPVAVLEGYSKMPVVKLGGYYTMPIKRTEGPEILPLQKRIFPLLSPLPSAQTSK